MVILQISLTNLPERECSFFYRYSNALRLASRHSASHSRTNHGDVAHGLATIFIVSSFDLTRYIMTYYQLLIRINRMVYVAKLFIDSISYAVLFVCGQQNGNTIRLVIEFCIATLYLEINITYGYNGIAIRFCRRGVLI